MTVPPTTSDRPGSPPRRPTISDVARAAGVSIAVVSYALNGRPGVSASTRERVLRVADEFGWRPNAAARSMRSGPRAVGLVLSRGAGESAHSTSFLDFVTAIQDVVAIRGLALVLQIVDSPEAAASTYRDWWAERRFDVMVVTDVLTKDPRIAGLRTMRAPAVVVAPREIAAGLASVWIDETESFTRVARYLLELGHRSIAAVTAPTALHRTQMRLDALAAAISSAGGTLAHEATNATAEEAAAATRRLLTAGERPSAIIFDSDQMAVAALDVARRTGLQVPWDLSVFAGSDSALCRLAMPSITTLPMPLAELGAATGHAVLSVLDGEQDVSVCVPVRGIAVRGSTGPRSR
ncbi:MAG: LacI family DNA-binding transcriptional regulator [Cellulomonas sp.]